MSPAPARGEARRLLRSRSGLESREENPIILKTAGRGKFCPLVLLACLLAAGSAAQQTPGPAGQAPANQEDKSPTSDDADKSNNNKAIQRQEKTGTSNDRLFLPCRIF